MISFFGQVRLKVISADSTMLLHHLSRNGIQLFDVQHMDELTVNFSINRQDYRYVKQFLKQREDSFEIVSLFGVYWKIKKLLKRPVLIVGILLLLFLVLYLPTRVLFVGIQGNHAVPTKLILEQAEECGIRFGASREHVRSEKVKNLLLESIPELQWAGINTYGCFAVISVDEEPDQGPKKDSGTYSNIVAVRDGVITQISVTKGTPKCEVGQSVRQGQVLVSGYADYGFKLTATGAEAEIFAQTGRSLTAITPAVFEKRGSAYKEETRYSLLLGKKLINFYKDSGILGGNCVRIYEEYYVVLPGGYRLPLGFVKEQRIHYEIRTEKTTEAGSFSWLSEAAESYLNSSMLAGEILSKYTFLKEDEGVCRLYGTYRCREMISRIRKEEILQDYEQRN